MPQKICIPEPLRELTDSQDWIKVNAANIAGAIEELHARFPSITPYLIDGKGGIRRFANLYVNGEDIRFLQNQNTPLKDGDEIEIMPAIISLDSASAAIAVAEQLRKSQHTDRELI